MGKPPAKKPSAPSAKAREPAGPMTLGNMRSLGPRSLDVTCKACGHREIVNVDAWPDDTPVASMGQYKRCSKCGHRGADVQPEWTQLRGVPGKATTMTQPDTKAQIAHEISIALERLGSDVDLLAIVRSWRDTLGDEEVLRLLREYNATGKILHRPQ